MNEPSHELFYDQLRQRIARFDPLAVAQFGASVTAVKSGDVEARIELAAGLIISAFGNPHLTESVFDQLAQHWLAERYPTRAPAASYPMAAATNPTIERCDNATFSPEFWASLRTLHEQASSLGPAEFTHRVVELGATLDGDYGQCAEQLACIHPGAAQAQTRTAPPRLRLAELAQHPTNSLATKLHTLLEANGFEPEVIDRQLIGLSALPPALCYLNTRILQMHDVWHLVAGYQTTGLHEIGISAFQLAQFGHNYSAMFLASIVSLGCAKQPEGLPILLQIISEGWLHGRVTTPFMAIAWEDEWHQDIATIRRAHSISPLVSQLPANLLESLAAAGSG